MINGARADRMADAIRSAGAKVVFDGPHVTEVPDEPLGRTEEPRHADAIALVRPTTRGRVSSPTRKPVNCRNLRTARRKSESESR
jgi:hypothetical protein